ncbi:MAG TPA: MFS transporter, partial [Oceanospirillaceae bacterium]|nr:MFS transporter [Oceanospirillaceae bacterium]
GFMYDLYGNYTMVWWVGVGVGALSAIVHLLVDERSIEQRDLVASRA